MKIGAIVLVIWLVIGALAAGQRGYFNSSPQNCAGAATVIVTIVAGPLNYLGVSPEVAWPVGPRRSSGVAGLSAAVVGAARARRAVRFGRAA